MTKCSNARAVARLKNIIPELEYARETHVQWRDCHQKYRDENPSIGDSAFHKKYVEIYDERIAAIKEAIEIINKMVEK